MKIRPLLLVAGALAALAMRPASAEEANSPEARLRDALKNTMLQLRTVSADRDNLQGQVTDLQSQKDDLTKQLADLTKKASTTQADLNKQISVLKGQIADQDGSIVALQKNLEQWKDAQRKAVKLLNETEAKRGKLADLSIKLQRIVDDQHRKNDEMYHTGMELLDRYEKFGLGQALTAKEPFVGITRAKFQTLVQDYEDKLTDQRIGDQPATQKTNTKTTQPQ